MSTYATLAQARNEIVKASSDTANTAYDGILMEYLAYITSRIDAEFKRWRFEPVLQTRSQDFANVNVLLGSLSLDAPLLSSTSIIDSDGAALVLWNGLAANRDAADVTPDPLNDTPIANLIKLNEDSWENPEDDYGQGIFHITGIWGYRRNYASAWKSSGDALAAGIAANATSWSVADADGADITGRTPRFSPGQLCKIDSEYMNVTAVNTTTNAVSVEPGVNGTTSAIHAISAPIYTWYPEPTIIRATLRWADFLFSRRGTFEQITVDGLGGATKFPTDMPDEIKTILAQIPAYPALGVMQL